MSEHQILGLSTASKSLHKSESWDQSDHKRKARESALKLLKQSDKQNDHSQKEMGKKTQQKQQQKQNKRKTSSQNKKTKRKQKSLFSES